MSVVTATARVAPATPVRCSRRACSCGCAARTRSAECTRRAARTGASLAPTRGSSRRGKALTRMSATPGKNAPIATEDAPEMDRAVFAAATGLFSPVVMPSVPVDAVSPARAALRGPSCLLDEADGEALAGETGGSDFGIVRLVRDEGWGLSTGALAAVLAVAGCGRAGAFGVFHTHDDTTVSAAVLTRTAVAHTQSVEQRRLRDADAGALLPKAGNVVRERWFAGSLNAIG